MLLRMCVRLARASIMDDGIAMDFSSVSNTSKGCDVKCHMDPKEVRKRHCKGSYVAIGHDLPNHHLRHITGRTL